MKPKTSLIWNYFIAIGDEKARCKICEKVYSRKGRTTSALKSHIKAMHSKEFAIFAKLDEEAKVSSETKEDETEEMGRKRKNNVYAYFKENSLKTESLCLLCDKTLRTTHGANLLKHLRTRHEPEYEIVYSLNKGLDVDDSMTSQSSQFIKTEIEDDDLEEDNELWNFYDKEGQGVKCSMCNVWLKTKASAMTQHLKEHHPEAVHHLDYYKDEDENYTEVIYLEEAEVPKKRPRYDVLSEIQATVKETKRKAEEIKKQNKENDNEIDNFVKYISGLLKDVPKQAFDKLQMDIVGLIMDARVEESTIEERDSNKTSDETVEENEEQENIKRPEMQESTPNVKQYSQEKQKIGSKQKSKNITYIEVDKYHMKSLQDEEKIIENFGKYISCLLRTIPYRNIGSQVQMEIVKLIMTARLQTDKSAPILTFNGTIELQKDTDNQETD